jgi:hypothetical protein
VAARLSERRTKNTCSHTPQILSTDLGSEQALLRAVLTLDLERRHLLSECEVSSLIPMLDTYGCLWETTMVLLHDVAWLQNPLDHKSRYRDHTGPRKYPVIVSGNDFSNERQRLL